MKEKALEQISRMLHTNYELINLCVTDFLDEGVEDTVSLYRLQTLRKLRNEIFDLEAIINEQ